MGIIRMPTSHRIHATTSSALRPRESGIRHLLLSCGPSYVTRLIVAVVVETFQRHVSRWALSYIRVERGEVRFPALTHLYAAPSIVAVFGILGIVAALNHRPPECVFGAVTEAVCPVPSVIGTSTGRRSTSPQVANKHILFVSTLTATSQVSQPRSPWGFGDYGPSADDSS
jgi:hypothetical protein